MPLDTGAIPTTSNGDVHPPPVSRTVEYHRPSRNSTHHSPGTDMSLGMVSSTSSPRVPQSAGAHAPTSFRSPPITSPTNFDSNAHMLPSRAAPAPPGLMRRDSNANAPGSQQSLGAGPSRSFSKSASNSPNPNRYSAGASSGPVPSMLTATNGIPPPRPTRAGTMPYADYDPNPMQPMSASQGLARANAAAGGLSPAAGGLSFLPAPTPPPLHHQPFSSPANPYSTQGIEKGIEDTKLGLGMGMPMNVVEPSKEKELPNAPNTTRSRSGTGKSQKGKSIFGLSFSGASDIRRSSDPLTSQISWVKKKLRSYQHHMIPSI